MSPNIYDISWLHLGLAFALIVFPLGVLWYYRTGMIQDTVVSVIRMTVQLLLVGIYLELLFHLDNPWINIAWVMVMILVATTATIQRSELRLRLFFIPLFTALLLTMLITDFFFLGLIIQVDHFFEARYFIPITGMIIGNCMERNIIALNSFTSSISRDLIHYQFDLANGASRQEALRPFIREALKKAFNPLIANMAVIGLIALPGTMTGQILGGSNPSTAIKYQVMLLLAIFIAAMGTVILSLVWSSRIIIDPNDNIALRIKARRQPLNLKQILQQYFPGATKK